MNKHRKPEVAPEGLTRLTKTTLADLLWWFVQPEPEGYMTEEPGWMALEHAAKCIPSIPAPDRLTLRTLIRIRRKRALR